MSAAAVPRLDARHRRPGLTLYRYIVREAFKPTLFALIGLTVVVLTSRVLKYSELVINRGVDASSVTAILFYESVPMAGRMLPFALLVGALFGLGRMSADREILALETCGIAPARLTWPVVALASAGTLVAFAMALVATPAASRSLDRLLEAIGREKPWANLQPGTLQRFGVWQLEAREISANGDELRGVMLWTREIGETVFAERGKLAPAGDDVRIRLEDGAVLLSRHLGVDLLRFATLETELDAGNILERDDRDRVLSLSLGELATRARAFVPTFGHRLSPAELERQRRFAYPVATLIFGFLAVPLFLTRAQASRSAGAVMGLLCTLAYYGLVQFSEGLVQGDVIAPALGVWIPNAALAALACALLLRALRRHVLGSRFERGASSPDPEPEIADESSRLPLREPRLHRHTLFRYVASRCLRVTTLTFLALFSAYLLIDVMDRLEWFAEHGATGIEALRYYLARIPLLASRAVPLAVLFATSLTVSLLAAEGELLGMRSCGIPSQRALLPVLAIAALVAPLYFVFNNTILPRTNARADKLKRTEIRARTMQRLPHNVWKRTGNMVLQADYFDADRGVGENVTIYWLGSDELPVARTDAASMHHVGKGNWRLDGPSRIEVHDGSAHHVEAQDYVKLGESVATEVDTLQMSAARIAREADETEAAGFDASALRTDYYAKLAEPLSCIVLPAAVLFFAATGPPFPGPAQTLLVSGVIGVAYILLTAVITSMGHGGRVPPLLSGWAPVGTFALVAGYFGRRMWRRH